MFHHTLSARKIRRAETTLYLRGDLKTTARRKAHRQGLSLSRYIEMLIIDELANEFVASVKAPR